jgi:hypothetical protein
VPRQVTVRKLDHTGQQVFAYPGQVLLHKGPRIVLRTVWDREPLDAGFVVLERSDRWTEHFFTDRWYNIFEIRAAGGATVGGIKGWYCNIARPAHVTEDEVSAEDLALDLWVTADGRMQVLDEDEFAELPLSPEERRIARQALDELQGMVERRVPPFDGINDDG